jgi:16S rRNA (guanine527-N7)-methyltransferase
VAPDEPQLRAVLEEGLIALGLPAEPASLDRWTALALLLDRWSERINLTGHRGALAIAQRLLLEAAALSQVLPPAATIADLGSGAGIPGLPLALCRPASRIQLIESRERRHHFQRAAIRDLGLSNAIALHGRAEALEVRPCEGVVAQAMAEPPQALGWMLPWVALNGWVAIATNPGSAERLEHPELVMGQVLRYAAPHGPARAAWIAERRRADPRA